jgi:hypothetical protein
VTSARYEVLVGFVSGCDSATGGALLRGFNEWVAWKIMRKKPFPIAWPAVIAYRSWPLIYESEYTLADIPEELNEAIVDSLSDFLEGFLGEQAETAASGIGPEGGLSTDFRKLFKLVRRAPRMFVTSHRYELMVAFVCGCDAATEGSLLAGFQEWAGEKVAGHPEAGVSWAQLIVDSQSPDGTARPLTELPEEYGQAVSDKLLGLLDEFLAEREMSGASGE